MDCADSVSSKINMKKENSDEASSKSKLKPNSFEKNDHHESNFKVFYEFNVINQKPAELLNQKTKATKPSRKSQITHEENGKLIRKDENGIQNIFILTQMIPTKGPHASIFTCPFCDINCKFLISLIKHLDTFHSRFQIKFKLNNNDQQTDFISLNDNSNLNLVNGGSSASLRGLTVGFNILNNLKNLKIRKLLLNSDYSGGKIVFEIKIDQVFDGSYLGNPFDKFWLGHKGFSLIRYKPCKRLSVTYVNCNK
jgi:hypothetical protein